MKNTTKLNENDNSFMGTKEASKLWGVSQNTITKWCRENKINGAEHDDAGSPWRIPKDAKSPERK